MIACVYEKKSANSRPCLTSDWFFCIKFCLPRCALLRTLLMIGMAA